MPAHFLDPDSARSVFFTGQLVMAAIFIAGWFWFRSRSRQSGFRIRESDRPKPFRPPGGRKVDLANARLERKSPYLLGGIRLEGHPHEILGVSSQASEGEVQKAYRELMKRYHPDRVGRPGTREWNDAQKIAEALNRAKEEMLKRARGK